MRSLLLPCLRTSICLPHQSLFRITIPLVQVIVVGPRCVDPELAMATLQKTQNTVRSPVPVDLWVTNETTPQRGFWGVQQMRPSHTGLFGGFQQRRPPHKGVFGGVRKWPVRSRWPHLARLYGNSRAFFSFRVSWEPGQKHSTS